ncbi:hypothetical protein ACFU8T_05295 [Sphingobacterium spiritivorum]|uniref:hypothetical protein n=1 Tax=Sphingobacterium spiritivorum TaxID=258 RepID=UPI003682E59F
MKIQFLILILIALTTLIKCSTNKNEKWLGRVSKKDIYDKNIDKNKIYVLINLFDILDKKKIDISDIGSLPGETIDSSFNSRLLLLNKDSIPKSIKINKPGKASIRIYPREYKKNMVIYDVFLAKDGKGVM